MSDAVRHCQKLVREADKDRFLATLFAPAKHRAAMWALYAFNVEIARIAGVVREPFAGEIRLQWWSDVVAGERAEEARGHPVASAMLDVIAQYRLPRALFDRLLEARRFDVAGEPMHSLQEFEAYARDTSSTLIELAGRILDPDGIPGALRFAGPAGVSMGITAMLRALPLQASRGHLFIPADMLARYEVDPHDILAGKATEAVRALLGWARERAAFHYEAARPLMTDAPPHLRPAWLPVSLVPLYLRALDNRKDEPFQGVDVPQWRRQWVMWRTARTGCPVAA